MMLRSTLRCNPLIHCVLRKRSQVTKCEFEFDYEYELVWLPMDETTAQLRLLNYYCYFIQGPP